MGSKLRLFTPMCIVLAFCAASASAGQPIVRIHAAYRAFIVTVAPVDEESKNAENSVLYQRVGASGPWEDVGQCVKHVLPGGEVRFTREVEVEHDGMYQYTSRPMVGGTVLTPPTADSPPQAVVIVDTLAPVAEITSPAEGDILLAGSPRDVSWTSSDENLAENPAVLSWSSDGGKSWIRIAHGLPAEGTTPWLPPADFSGPALLRLTVSDLAGNIGRAMRQVEIKPPEPAAKTQPPPPAVVETTPEPTPPAPTPPPEPPVVTTPPEPEKPPEPEARKIDRNRSWLYYLMAINQMRQNHPQEALQYYWLSVKEDPDFINAWADIALAYIDLGAYKTAREIVEQTRDKAPERIDLMHLMGETYHAEGMALLTTAKNAEDRHKAKRLIDQAVEWYGRALEKAAADWKVGEQAPSFYRLGEICYYVNMDRDGARAYWRKVLELHSPTPNSDLVLWTEADKRDQAKLRYERYTTMRVSLEAWQNWARGYLEQLDARERAGIVDLMPAQRLNAQTRQTACDATGQLAPGRDDGKSLFSLPAQYGSPSPTPVGAAGEAAGAAKRPVSKPTEGYSFYAPKNKKAGDDSSSPPASAMRRDQRSAFSGGPDLPSGIPADPYVFPQGSRIGAGWNSYQPYGDRPADSW